jgi:hypothetical protein
MRKTKTETPPLADESQASLISSSTLPEFDDLERMYLEQFEEIERENQAATPAPKKRGRKSKDVAGVINSSNTGLQAVDITPDNAPIVQAEDIQDWAALPLDLLFLRMDKKPLGKIEKIAWGRSVAAVINKYAPMAASKYGAEIGLAICAISIFAVRMTPPKVENPEIAKGDKIAESLKE